MEVRYSHIHKAVAEGNRTCAVKYKDFDVSKALYLLNFASGPGQQASLEACSASMIDIDRH